MRRASRPLERRKVTYSLFNGVPEAGSGVTVSRSVADRGVSVTKLAGSTTAANSRVATFATAALRDSARRWSGSSFGALDRLHLAVLVDECWTINVLCAEGVAIEFASAGPAWPTKPRPDKCGELPSRAGVFFRPTGGGIHRG